MKLGELVEWGRVAYPFSGDIASIGPPRDVSEVTSNAARVASVYAAYDEDQDSDPDLLFRLATGLNGLATFVGDTDGEAAKATYGVVFLSLSSRYTRDDQPAHYQKAINYAYRNFRALGGTQPTREGLPQRVFLDLTAIMDQMAVPDDEDEAGARDARCGPPAPGPAAGIDVLARLAQACDTGGLYLTPDKAFDRLRGFIAGKLDRSELMDGPLAAVIDRDAGELTAGSAFIGVPMDSAATIRAARGLRHSAYDEGLKPADRRQRWLLSGIVNHAVLTMPGGLPTNHAQVLIDLMGYLVALETDSRYNDQSRDLLLDCAEAVVRLAHILPELVFARFRYIREWLLATVGTYFLLAGPNPTRPSDSYYDPRIHSADAPAERGLKRAERQAWPEMLLSQWQAAPELADGACFALASLCGWDLARCCWLVAAIYDESEDAQRLLSQRDWSERLAELLARVERVRIATNPWGTDKAVFSRGTVITNDQSGRFIVPNELLKAAVAQGLRRGEAATVQGHLFEGRRVPTYLLSSKFGPFAILKIDHRDKVRREVANFESYAERRLHPNHRPSSCDAYKMDMYLGEDGTPLRAITTSYVFSEDDRPLTLGQWLANATPDEAVEAVERFLLKSVRPWLSHVRRDRVDIRAEYPVLRPAPAAGKQQADHWADIELTKLESAGAAELVGVQLSRKLRECDWLDRVLADLGVEGAVPQNDDLVNPLWLAAELAEIGSGVLNDFVDSHELRDCDTLLCISHGDLHLDNILCTSSSVGGPPRTVLIDFESAHEGHICKDLARLEASVLCQVFHELEPADLRVLFQWFAHGFDDVRLWEPGAAGEGTGAVPAIVAVASKLRQVTDGCGQRLWPIRPWEYSLALFGSLLPMVRWQSLSLRRRQKALMLATIVGSALMRR